MEAGGGFKPFGSRFEPWMSHAVDGLITSSATVCAAQRAGEALKMKSSTKGYKTQQTALLPGALEMARGLLRQVGGRLRSQRTLVDRKRNWALSLMGLQHLKYLRQMLIGLHFGKDGFDGAFG